MAGFSEEPTTIFVLTMNTTAGSQLPMTTTTTTPSLSPSPQWWLHEMVVGPIRDDLAWAWLLHTYGVACLFCLLAVYAFFSVLYLRSQLSTQPFMATVDTFLCVLGATRATVFLIDPYNLKEIIPEAIGAVLWELAYPCLLSAFSLVQLTFVQVTQLRMGSAPFRSKSCLSLVIAMHFCLVIAINFLWTFRDDLRWLSLAIRTIFCCWGSLLCINFLLGGWRTMKLLQLINFSRSPSPRYSTKGILQLGILAKCNNLASVAATVAAPTFVMPPKIRITDENEYSYSYISDSSHTGNDSGECETTMETIEDGCRVPPEVTSPRKSTACPKSPLPLTISRIPQILENGSACKSSRVDDDHSKTSLLEDSSRSSSSFGSGAPASSANKMVNDVTLNSILNHIAFVDNTLNDFSHDPRHLRPTRHSQIRKFLRATCVAAILGLVVSFCHLYTIFGPYGLCGSNTRPAPLAWFTFHTIFRLAEFAMGFIMANITQQPVNRHHFPYVAQDE